MGVVKHPLSASVQRCTSNSVCCRGARHDHRPYAHKIAKGPSHPEALADEVTNGIIPALQFTLVIQGVHNLWRFFWRTSR